MIREKSKIARRSGIPRSLLGSNLVRVEKAPIGSYRTDLKDVPTVLSLPIRIQFGESSKDKFISATLVSPVRPRSRWFEGGDGHPNAARYSARETAPFEIHTSSLEFRKHRGSIPPFQRHSLASEFRLSVSVDGDTWEFYERIQRGHPALREATVAPIIRVSNNTL